MNDPNWLLSSTAQSAAAMVAIVGGFLVSRLVSLSTERAEVVHRREELVRRRQQKLAEYEDRHYERLEVSHEWFVEHHVDQVIEAGGSTVPSDLLDGWIPSGSNRQEMEEVAVGLVRMVGTATDAIESKYYGHLPPTDPDELREAGLEISHEWDLVYERVARAIRAKRSGRYIDALLDASATPSSMLVHDVNRQDARIEAERSAQSEYQAFDVQVKLLDDRLQSFVRPDGVRGAVLALAYLALVGIATPTVMMAVRPVPDGAASRILVVCAFLSGLVVLLIYFARRLYVLQSPPSEPKDH